MPYDQVMPQWKTGKLRSGGADGPVVNDQKQAVAIMLSEKQKAEGGKTEYKPKSKKPKAKSHDRAASLHARHRKLMSDGRKLMSDSETRSFSPSAADPSTPAD